MQVRLQTRIRELQEQFDIGQAKLHDLNRQKVALQDTILRISGAIQVLEELLMAPSSPNGQNMPSMDDAQALTQQDLAAERPGSNAASGGGTSDGMPSVSDR